MQTLRIALGTLLALALVVGSAAAGPPTEQLQRRVDEVIRVLDDPALKDRPADRRGKIRQLAEDIFDYPDTARRALGPHWNARSPQERQEFVKLFADLLDRAYISKIDVYQGEKVRWVGETMNGDEAVVKTAITTKSGTDVPVEYRMHQRDGRWLVYDVIIEGVSLVANYRTQFNKIVQTESYDVLVQKLKAGGTSPAASPGKR
jgi:phospholipid transport system substrate-binding protein